MTRFKYGALQDESLQRNEARHDPRLEWWREARFGMFIHWGLYAIPAGVWQGRHLPGIGEWIMKEFQIPVVLLSARGRPFRHADAVRFSVEPELTLLCGHYKDVDQRVADHLATDEISLGDFVLSGGEVAALAITDAVVRLQPGALGDHDAAATDSFYDGGKISAPSFTRPPEYRGLVVPEVLRSGDHARIEAWRREQSERLTRLRDEESREG